MVFMISIFSEYKLIIVFIYSIVFFMIFSVKSIMFLTGQAWVLTVFIGLPSGVYQGVDRIWEMIISFLICLVAILLYDLLFTKIIINYTLKYTSELVNDLFYVKTAKENKDIIINNIRNKFLFEKRIICRADIRN